ncbi:STAS domain-containing protein [Desulfosporosinus sp.]|uniref:STAS domain-containing protein n=1 Tax=Desulfosporosinus sp. TaxID=157907 RepID=UPI0025BD5DDF|nr:STAS domain-containing protein [Desulfosporosinus sp.]MBC2724523.1 STAS domain-containing protein [Desulfosporosinus sp.]MBC2727197.1 STAS domain-containing protein [Desulfosporosinus sp.]
MKHSIKVSGNHASVFLMDKIYVHDASLLRDDLLEIIDQGIIDIKIDLSGLTYIDSSGLGTLVTINKRTKEKNGRLVLVGAQGLPFDLIKRTRLDKVFIIE